ncbi:class I tRNA ligase family protein, partial [Acidithiobacillus sp.]
MTDTLDRPFAPAEIETQCYTRWEAHGLFQPEGDGTPYCIMLPPPNVTGTLHMGHAFQDTLMDILTRVHRMRGERTLWQPGTDHAGIATQ